MNRQLAYIAVCLVMSGADMAHGANSADSTAVLNTTLNIARNYLLTSNEILVKGYTNLSITDKINESLLAGYPEKQEKLLQTRELLLRQGNDYYDFKTKLNLIKSDISAKQVVLEASEYTVYKLSRASFDPLAPATTEETHQHRFTFSQKNGKWQLVSDEVLDDFAPAKPANPTQPAPTDIIGPAIDNEQVLPPPGLSIQRDDLSSAEPFASSPVYIAGMLNRGAIVNYAYTYWNKYNSAYRRFASDCTNFISQALNRGGWGQITGWYTSSDVWWYNYTSQSYTWAGAENFYQFTGRRPRAFSANGFYQLVPGDIVQADWNRDGIKDHTMIVTKKDGNGLIYLTYHSANTKDKSINLILSQYPYALYYGWILHNPVY